MKLAAIDIGSNAVRLHIARPLNLNKANSNFKKVEYLRLPLRLGDDVFLQGEISKRKKNLLEKAMQSFLLIMDVYNVDEYFVAATSAMRDAKNAKTVINEIYNKIGLKINVLSGEEESKYIQHAVLQNLPFLDTFLHVDIGGGSTEIAWFENRKSKFFESFNIGSVRLKENKVQPSEIFRMYTWLNKILKKTNPEIPVIGTGGNLLKLHELSGVKFSDYCPLSKIIQLNQKIEKLSHEERVYDLKLNPDRAEVITHAANLIIDIMQHTNCTKLMAPDVGLKEGIILSLWNKNF